MIRMVRLFGVLFSMSVRRSVTFRADLLFEIGLTIVGAASSLAALGVVYTRTDSLGGWSPAQAIVLLGSFQIVEGLRLAFVEPNMDWFGEHIRDGRFDAVLVQPAPAIFLASIGTCAPHALTQVGLGFGIVATAVIQAGVPVTLVGLLAWLVLLAAATVLMWAARVSLAALVFWALGLDLTVVYDAVWQFARYPVQVYSRPLRLLLTYAVPVALIATVPADVLTRGGGLSVVPVALAIAAAAATLAVLLWRSGVRRYTSATS